MSIWAATFPPTGPLVVPHSRGVSAGAQVREPSLDAWREGFRAIELSGVDSVMPRETR